jgi:hypothetical protein
MTLGAIGTVKSRGCARATGDQHRGWHIAAEPGQWIEPRDSDQ